MNERQSADFDDVVRREHLPPDGGLVKSLGAHHSFESAVADLVDNSLDAGASKVSVVLLTSRSRLAHFELHDNGQGLDEEGIKKAMMVGHRREYIETDLGYFGIGLKAASFAHCDVLTALSLRNGCSPVGRRIRRTDFSKDFTCEVLTSEPSMVAADNRERMLGSRIGTSIIWTEIRNTYGGKNPAEAETWLANLAQKLRAHLGVIFHRFIKDEGFTIEVLVDELNETESAIAVPVQDVNPFGYSASGHPGYPKVLVAPIRGKQVELHCHIWPARSDVTGFRIGGQPGQDFQGFFIYRNKRLLQAGGWSDVATRAQARQLARVEVEIDTWAEIESIVAIAPEKAGLRFGPDFHDAVSHAVSEDGTTFDQFLKDAEFVYTESKRRQRRRKPAIAPERGFAPELRRIIGRELTIIYGSSLSVQWRPMQVDEFIGVDESEQVLWLNSRYRYLFAPDGGSLNDAPVIKALLYLLSHHVFEGQYLGAKDRDEVALWKSVLGAAVKVEARMREGHER